MPTTPRGSLRSPSEPRWRRGYRCLASQPGLHGLAGSEGSGVLAVVNSAVRPRGGTKGLPGTIVVEQSLAPAARAWTGVCMTVAETCRRVPHVHKQTHGWQGGYCKAVPAQRTAGSLSSLYLKRRSNADWPSGLQVPEPSHPTPCALKWQAASAAVSTRSNHCGASHTIHRHHTTSLNPHQVTAAHLRARTPPPPAGRMCILQARPKRRRAPRHSGASGAPTRFALAIPHRAGRALGPAAQPSGAGMATKGRAVTGPGCSPRSTQLIRPADPH